MNGPTDQQLLREYAERRAETAFGELVHRHVDLVYSAALRMVCDAHLAEDVTQGVFLALARSAGQLTECAVLSGWLHRTAQNLAANVVRSDVRRRAREQEAAAMNESLSIEPDAPWEEIAPHLDAALGELSEPDRDALLLRYFERKSAREMAQRLGTTEEAAQKRVSRAVERLRELLAKRGVTTGAGALVVVLSANAVQSAPMGLALSISASTAVAGAAVSTFATTTAAKTVAMTTVQKAVVATTLAVAIGVGTYQTHQASRLRAEVKTMTDQHALAGAASRDADISSLATEIQRPQAQNGELANALAEAKADKARLEAEREQARHSAALFKELVDQSDSRDATSTNLYPTSRHVWAAWGRLGRLAIEFKQDDSKLSPEEKSAKEAAKSKAVEEMVGLIKATQQLDANKPSGSDSRADDTSDDIACVLYGALNLDEQQFGQVYALVQKYGRQAKQDGLLKEDPTPETAAALKQVAEQAKAELQTILTPEQARIFTELEPLLQTTPGRFGINVSF